jgi:hypothetical protein
VQLYNSRSERNGFAGFGASNNSRVTINRSVASGNLSAGFVAVDAVSGGVTELSCEECVSNRNSVGFSVAAFPGGGATIRASHSTATNNSYGFSQNLIGVFESAGNNFVRGNPGGDTQGDIGVFAAK